MVSPIIFRNDSLARGIETAGSALGAALGERAQEGRERERYQKDATTLQQIISKASANPSIQEVQQLQLEAFQAGISPALIKSTMDMYTPYLTENVKSQGTENLLNRLGIRGSKEPDESQRQQFTQLDEYEPEGMYAQRQQSPGLEQSQEASPITTVKKAQAFAKAPVEKQKEFIRGQGETDLSNMSDSNLLELSMSRDPAIKNAVDTELKMRDSRRQTYKDERKYHQQGATEAEKNASAIRNSLRPKEASIRLAEEAIATDETGPLSMANIANRLGIPELMNAAGTELNQAGKEFFIGTLSRVSAKAQNQWLEQRISQLFSQVGDPKINAMMKTTMLKAELKANRAYLNEYDRLAKEDLAQYGYIKKDIEQRAYEASEDAHSQIINETSYKTRQLYEQEKGYDWLKKNIMKKVPKGTYLTEDMARILNNEYKNDYEKVLENAEKLGYTIPSKQDKESWE